MSFLNKTIFKIFLFLALWVFGVSAAFSDITLKYYQSDNYLFCSKNHTDVCDYTVTQWGSNPNYIYENCVVTTTQVQIGRKQKSYQYSTNPDGTTNTTVIWLDNGFVRTGAVLSKTCPDNTTLELRGCTATCVADPCANLKGQRENISTQCGTLTCSKGVTSLVGSSFVCSEGVGSFSASSPSGDAVKNSCAMVGITSESPPTLAEARAKSEDIGGSSVPMYCNYEYEYTGVSGGQDSPTNAASLTFTGGATKMPDDGICKDPTPLKGQLNGVDVCYPNTLPDSPCPVAGEVPNSNGVCVGPNDPTYPDGSDPKPDPNNPDTSCPTGEIRNNQGKCVPYADAIKCPAGEIRDNLGTCSPDPKSNSCPQGTVKNTVTGACITDPRGSGCEGNALPDKNGMCPNGKASCPVGMVRNSSGLCVSSNPNNPPEGTGCKDGSAADSNGKCADGSGVCPAGQVRNIQGKCVVDSTNTPSSATASGDCLSAPECSGDIVQCGLMHQQWQSGCDLKKAMTDVPEGGDTKYSEVGTNTNDARVTGALDSLTGYSNQVKSLLAVNPPASCPADISLNLLGHSIVVPISKACPLFVMMRFLLALLVDLACLRILYKSFVGD